MVDRDRMGQVEIGGVNDAVDSKATMHAGLDLLCMTVCCSGDEPAAGAVALLATKLSDAEIVTLCVAQVLTGIRSDRCFLKAARRQLTHLFALLPSHDLRTVAINSQIK